MNRVLGPVVRLQIQRDRLKPGERGTRVYDPAPLLGVDALHAAAAGCLGRVDDGWLVDVHHAEHPNTRHRSESPVSLMTTAAYRWLRARYGTHLADGVAGENVLVDSDVLLMAETPSRLTIGRVQLDEVAVAEPCVEFSRWCAGLPVGESAREELIALRAGARGWIGVPVEAGLIGLGDAVSLD